MTTLLKTDANHKDFISLVASLDTYLAVTDGDDHAFYDQFNKLDTIKHAVIIYLDNTPVACGAIKELDATAMELKRMFTQPSARGKGFAKQILTALEGWAFSLGYQKCLLETGVRQPDAIGLYLASGYQQIENYGQYKNLDESLCFEKLLNNIE
ncbi:MAG: putative acetyltransferase [Patiriisocius sp.]|jgi:GNAT superfamily N-acetyltransferase